MIWIISLWIVYFDCFSSVACFFLPRSPHQPLLVYLQEMDTNLKENRFIGRIQGDSKEEMNHEALGLQPAACV